MRYGVKILLPPIYPNRRTPCRLNFIGFDHKNEIIMGRAFGAV
jgi:hypothetical protein